MSIVKTFKGKTAASIIASAKIDQARNGTFNVYATLPEHGTCLLRIETNKTRLTSEPAIVTLLSASGPVCALSMSERTYTRMLELHQSARARTAEGEADNWGCAII